ncbi:MAG TPA: hypothetical protein VM325_06290 [Alphaproteobacteria bacterium]|nr:hypothetical protein [Alphaproteobacteria bacterium]
MAYAKDKAPISGYPIDLYHRPRSSLWWAKFKVKGYDRVELSTGSREFETAKAWAINELPEIVANLKRYGTAKARTFKQVATEYLRECKTKEETGQMAPERYRRAKRITEGLFLPYFKQKPVNAFTDRDINNWLAWRMTKGLGKRGTASRATQKPAKGTLRTELSFLRGIFYLGVREGYLHHTQAPRIKGDYSTLYTDRRDHFSQEEWHKLEA